MSLLSKIGYLYQHDENNKLVGDLGMTITTISWEDTARAKNSCWGPNISDMTLNVDDHRMPMIRKPNFYDETTDVDIDKFHVSVGNECGASVKRIPLKEYLQDFLNYNPTFDKESSSLLLERDEKILVSAQACVLPLANSQVEFVPQIFNYQTTPLDPAVLVIVASANGTSASIVTERHQKLYFNNNGKAFQYTATRLSTDRKNRNKKDSGEPMDLDEMERNVLMIFQIPLKQKEIRNSIPDTEYLGVALGMGGIRCQSKGIMPRGGMENAMLSVSNKSKGPFKGGNGLKVQRDERYPIRLTFQYYKVTDTHILKKQDVTEINTQITNAYNIGSNTGSLVDTTTNRVTEPTLEEKTRNPLFSLFSYWRK